MIGNTPMIKISDKIYAKAEIFNPTGSIKDRPASYILDYAELMGDLKKVTLSSRPLQVIWEFHLLG